MFPILGYLCNVVRIKQELWNRYGFFFNVDTIQEVYPDNEIASWVAGGYEDYSMGLAEVCDEELSFERLNWSFDDRWPKKLRSFDEEMRVLDGRERWHQLKNVFELYGVMYYTNREQRIYRGEELPRCLLFDDTRIKNQNAYYWKRRRNIMKEQYNMKEPDWAKLDEICRDKGNLSAVSYQTTKVPFYCCRSIVNIVSFLVCAFFLSSACRSIKKIVCAIVWRCAWSLIFWIIKELVGVTNLPLRRRSGFAPLPLPTGRVVRLGRQWGTLSSPPRLSWLEALRSHEQEETTTQEGTREERTYWINLGMRGFGA